MTNPQTGLGQDQYGCAVAWLPVMLVENAGQTRRVSAAVESARNEITTRQDTFNQLAIESQRKRTPELDS